MPMPLADCLLDHPQGCSYSDYALYFDEKTKGEHKGRLAATVPEDLPT